MPLLGVLRRGGVSSSLGESRTSLVLPRAVDGLASTSIHLQASRLARARDAIDLFNVLLSVVKPARSSTPSLSSHFF